MIQKEHSSLFSLPRLIKINGGIDITRRIYNRLSSWFNLLGLSLGRFNRLIPLVGLMLNLAQLSLRLFITHHRTQSPFLHLAFKSLMFFLMSSSIAIYALNLPFLIVKLTLLNALTRILLDLIDFAFLFPQLTKHKLGLEFYEMLSNLRTNGIHPKNSHPLQKDPIKLQNLIDQTQHNLFLSGVRLTNNIAILGLSYWLFSVLSNPPLAFMIVLGIEILEIAAITILINNIFHPRENEPSALNTALLAQDSTYSIINQLGSSPADVQDEFKAPENNSNSLWADVETSSSSKPSLSSSEGLRI